MAAELVVDWIARSRYGYRRYIARVLEDGEWKMVELPPDVAEKILAELAEAIAHLVETVPAE